MATSTLRRAFRFPVVPSALRTAPAAAHVQKAAAARAAGLGTQQRRCAAAGAERPQEEATAAAAAAEGGREEEAAAAAEVEEDHILTLSCADRPGLIHAATGVLARQGLNIWDLQQFSDPQARRFFMRIHFGRAAGTAQLAGPLETALGVGADEYRLGRAAHRPRVMVMVSKTGHCLNDLLFRRHTARLGIDVPLVVSNHADLAPLARRYGVPFHHLPVPGGGGADAQAQHERRLLALIAEHRVDLVVLARYMQVLSPGLCAAMSGRIINIHHSFLPSFKGARPYHQAYERGVKIVGATAHFVTADLDEGPIIEQRIARADHSMGAHELTQQGSDVETQTLAAAVKWWSERRVFLNGSKTVVFK